MRLSLQTGTMTSIFTLVDAITIYLSPVCHPLSPILLPQLIHSTENSYWDVYSRLLGEVRQDLVDLQLDVRTGLSEVAAAAVALEDDQGEEPGASIDMPNCSYAPGPVDEVGDDGHLNGSDPDTGMDSDGDSVFVLAEVLDGR
jgi:hypothetical protein